MKMGRGLLGVAMGLGMVGALFSTGCAGPDRSQIDAQQAKIAELQKQRDALEAQLASALRDSDANRRRAADLQRQLDAAKASGELTKRGDFTEANGVAWANIAEDILFDSGKADLKATGRQKLQDIVRQIQQNYRDHNIFVVGHTDNDPIKVSKWKDNLDLSLGRGRVVAMELMSLGIPAEHVVAAGQGEWNPIKANDSKPNKKFNRRVQIVAVHRPIENPQAGPQVGNSAEEG